MKIKSIIILCIASLLACCTCTNVSKGPYVDPDLKYAYNDWKDECDRLKIKVKHNTCDLDSIIFGELEKGYWGKCYKDKIVINNSVAAPSDTFLLKLIMYHELGHCAFDYKHDDNGLDIMNSILPEGKIIVYKLFWGILKENYFSRYEVPKTRTKLRYGNSCGEIRIQNEPQMSYK